MKIVADMHCHTLASTHAYSTIEEISVAAARKGLYAIAVTDHGRTMPGSPGPWYFENLCVIEDEMHGVRIFKGIEANVCDYSGRLDIDEVVLRHLNWVVASMHEITLEPVYDIEACTNAWLNVANNPAVNVIGHSGVQAFTFDYEKVIPEFARNGKLIEINNTSFRVRPDAISNCKTIAILCKKYGAQVIINSDAHSAAQIGVVDHAMQLIREIDFPEELVVNSSVENFQDYLRQFNERSLKLQMGIN